MTIFSLERSLKVVHGWMGVFILPWVVMIGLTGVSLNHWELVSELIAAPSYDESQFDVLPTQSPIDEFGAISTANKVFPDNQGISIERGRYHDRDVWLIPNNDGKLIVDTTTGHYWVKSRYSRKTYNPKGVLLHSKVYWGSLFKTLHVRGWYNSKLGTVLADITGFALVVFGLSGIFIFIAPRLRRRKNRIRKKPMAKNDQN